MRDNIIFHREGCVEKKFENPWSNRTMLELSLNDVLHASPRLQPNLANILFRWRLDAIVFKADREKMFRQIQILRGNQDWERVL